MLTRINHIYCKYLLFFLVVIISCHFLASTGYTDGIVSARYTSISDNHVKFIVNIGTLAPSNIIVQHFHPPGSNLTNTSPRASKISKGFAKWFLKDIGPGTLSFTLSFSKAVQRNKLKAVLRYRDPQTGNFIEAVVHP